VAALQVRTPEGEWKYVKPYPESITVNIADALQFLTNGFLKSSIHRVIAPPPDQAHIDRHGVLYFVRPEDDTELVPIKSPVLERLGYDKALDQATVGLTAGEWVRARVAKNVSRQGREEESIIKGVKAKYYD
jgi:isopenicillin N synthase-like dioxygenase